MAATPDVFAAEAGNESVIVHNLPSTSTPDTSPPPKSKSRTRAAFVLLLAILAIVAATVAITNNSTSGGQAIPDDSPSTRSEATEIKAAAVKKEDIPEAAEAPKPAPKAKPPKKQDNMLTMIPTSGLTATVSTEVSSPPTVSDRSDRRNMIQSPTWRG